MTDRTDTYDFQQNISILNQNYRSMKREQILIEALPYIRDFYGSFVVIKIGGHAMIDKRLMEGIIEDIVLLRYVGMQPVLVHGGDLKSVQKWSGWAKSPNSRQVYA